MHKHKSVIACSALLAWALTLSNGSAQSAPPADGPAARLDSILAAFPATNAAQAAGLYKQITDGGAAQLELLCSRVLPPSTNNNAVIRFAIHGVVNHAARPGAGDERRTVAATLLKSAAAAADDEVKDFLLEQLRFVADSSHIPALEPVLKHDRLASRAAAILANIGGQDAEKALLAALPGANDSCKLHLLGALAWLGSKSCVKECEAALDTKNAPLARTALNTLARAGSTQAAAALKTRIQNPPAGLSSDEVRNAYLAAIERIADTGNEGEAATLASAVLADAQKPHAGVRCRMLALIATPSGSAATPALIAALGDPDRSVRSFAAGLLSKRADQRVTDDLLAATKSASGATLAATLDALSQRQDLKDITPLADGLKSTDGIVRTAAVNALRRVATPAAAQRLLSTLHTTPQQEAQPIIDAVKSMSSKAALTEIAAHLEAPSAIVRETALNALATHRAREYAGRIMKLTIDPEAQVATAAFNALSVISSESDLAALIDSALAATNAAYRKATADTIAAAAPRLEQKDKISAQLMAAIKDSAPERKCWILSVLPPFGGKSALDLLVQSASAPENETRDAAVRALAAWPDDTALPALETLVTGAAAPNHRVLALRGATRILKESPLPPADKLASLGRLLKSAPTPGETRLVISGLAEVTETGAIELLLPLLDNGELAPDAALAIARIACPDKAKAADLPADKAEPLLKACELVKDQKLQQRFRARLPKTKAKPTPPATTAATTATDDAGFNPLFNGKDLTGWIGDTKGYMAEDGKIVCKPGGNLYTEKEYANFIFRFEFKLTPGANNGLGIRTPPKGNAAYAGMELQILDDTADKYKNLQPYQYHGSIYGIVPCKRGHQKPVGEWNYQEVIADGPKIKITLNGTVIIDADLSTITQTPNMHDLKKHTGLHNPKGHIGFLGHGSVVEFRNIRIKELPAAPAAPAPAAPVAPTASAPADPPETAAPPAPPEGFTALFNGKDLTGWKGLLKGPNDNPIKRATLSPDDLAKAQAEADENMRAHWSVRNGILEFDGKGRSLCTARDYKDFELYVDWKIKANGDSGIYLRGSPQVQIWDPTTHPMGSGGLFNNKLNPSKPSECADKPVGQWNTFHIKMVGEKVTVDLNGKRVVDNVVLENYWDRNQPIFPSGQIELQNHGNNLYFKNIYLKEIKE